MKVEFFKHNIEESDIENAIKVLKSPFLSTGKEVEIFEKKFAEYLGCKHVVGVTSCTSALQLCLLAYDIGQGSDEVITTPMSFISTANSIFHAGAIPRFVDVEPVTGMIDVGKIGDVINEDTRAILPVHLYGQQCDLSTIKKIAGKHNLKVVVDAAHAVEIDHDFDFPTCFSFYPTKSMTCGEGGAIATNDKELADKLRLLRLHGMDSTAIDRYHKKYKHYDMVELGWKYNMNNIQAALLNGQIDYLDRSWMERGRIFKIYNACLPIDKIVCPIDSSEHAYHLYTILVPNRDKVMEYLQDNGVGVGVHYRPIHLMSYYRTWGYIEGDFPNAEEIGEKTLSLPLYPKLTDKEVEYVIEKVNEAVECCI